MVSEAAKSTTSKWCTGTLFLPDLRGIAPCVFEHQINAGYARAPSCKCDCIVISKYTPSLRMHNNDTSVFVPTSRASLSEWTGLGGLFSVGPSFS